MYPGRNSTGREGACIFDNGFKLKKNNESGGGRKHDQVPRTQVKVMMPSFQETRIVPLYWVQMLSAMERPMP